MAGVLSIMQGTVAGSGEDTPSAIVAGAGTAAANGEYPEVGTENGRPSYNNGLSGNDEMTLSWTGDRWLINQVAVDYVYYSPDDAAFPWLAITWLVEALGVEPVPTVTEG